MNSFYNDDQQRGRLRGRRLEKLPRGSFKRRQAIEKNRQQIRAYKESKVVLNEEGRKAVFQETRQADDSSKDFIAMLQPEREEPSYHRPLPSAEQRPAPPPPNRFINPTNMKSLR